VIGGRLRGSPLKSAFSAGEKFRPGEGRGLIQGIGGVWRGQKKSGKKEGTVDEEGKIDRQKGFLRISSATKLAEEEGSSCIEKGRGRL